MRGTHRPRSSPRPVQRRSSGSPRTRSRGGFRYVVARGDLTARRFPETGTLTAPSASRMARWSRRGVAGRARGVNHHSSATPGDGRAAAGARRDGGRGAEWSDDPASWERPAVVDPGRPRLWGHLAFNFGPRHCVGAHLAMMEATEAILGFWRAFPDLGHAVGEPTATAVGFVSRASRPVSLVHAPAAVGRRSRRAASPRGSVQSARVPGEPLPIRPTDGAAAWLMLLSPLSPGRAPRSTAGSASPHPERPAARSA